MCQFVIIKDSVYNVTNFSHPSMHLKSSVECSLHTVTLNPNNYPNCNEGNTQDAKFCSKCKMIMSFEGYQDAESEKHKEDKLAVMEEKFNDMQSMMEKLITGLGKATDQQQTKVLATAMFNSGLLKVADTKKQQR